VVPVINLPVDWQVPDVLKLRLADDEAMTVNVRTLAHTLSDADVGTISIGIPSLSVPTWFAAYGAHGGVDSSNLSNKVKWGDTTTPTITSASSFSQTELLPLAFALTANETVTWSISGGADQTQYEISGSTLRWYGNGTQDYTAPADSDGNNTYAVQVTATDLGGNSANQTITGTVTAADRTPDAFSFTPVIPATPSTQYTSNTITVAGLTPGLSVTATLTGGGAYSKNGGAYTSAAGTAQNGDTFTLRVTSGPGATDVLNLGMTIGLGSASWVVSNTTNTAAWTTSPGTSLNSNMTISGSPPLSLATAGILASQLVRANAAASSKRYLEFTLNSTPTGDIAIGVDDGTTSFGPTTTAAVPGHATSTGLVFVNGSWGWEIKTNSIAQISDYASGTKAAASGDKIGLEFDTTAHTCEVWRKKSGTWTSLGTVSTGFSLSAYYAFGGVLNDGGSDASGTVNFGATAFDRTPSAGFVGYGS
jgi:hypothetical protein